MHIYFFAQVKLISYFKSKTLIHFTISVNVPFCQTYEISIQDFFFFFDLIQDLS
jgi:hypothetical protein